MNLTVIDHLRDGRATLERANRLEAEGTPLALREAAALRRAQALKSEALMGDTTTVRTTGCPACGCYSLIPRQDRVFCINRHCGPRGIQRRWYLTELALLKPGTAKAIGRTSSPTAPRDAVDTMTAIAFFAPTGHPMSASTISRIAKTYGLPSWKRPGHRALYYSLSDLATAHAVHTAGRTKTACSTAPGGPACTGLADLFFGRATQDNEARITAAKELCDACPLKALCLETALELSGRQQHGIYGGLTADERRELIANRTN